jgi:beta-lactamase regulating signal transducer with metallopeptidase domain
MSPDIYLGFAALFINYFLKVAVACLLCWILSTLVNTSRQRFSLWLGFTLGSLAYWLYAVTSFSFSVFSAGDAGTVLHLVSRAHQFLVPTKFQFAIVIFGRILGSAYILGVLLLISVGIWKRVRLRLLLRQGTAPSAELQQLFSEMCRQFGVRHCELLILSGINSPATVYWWRPRIVLPQVCGELNESTLIADILSHELAHVARRDYLWSSISDVICGLLFFHPGVWQARKQMRIQREMACDHAVVSARPEHRVDYAHTLTRVARLILPRKYRPLGIDFATAPSLLRHRVEAILNDSEKASRGKRFSRALAGTVLIGGYGFLCAVVAIAISFVPAVQPRSTSVTASPNSLAVSTPAHKVRRPRSQPEEQSYIAESPAYRLPSAATSSYAAESSASSAEPVTDSQSTAPFPTFPDSGRRSVPVGKTVESVIVSTVGTVLANDKDERPTTTATTTPTPTPTKRK